MESVNTTRAPLPIGPYSQGIVAYGRMLFTSGQIAIDPVTNQVVAGDIRHQTRLVLENLKAILGEAGSGPQWVIKTTVYLKDMGEFAAMNEVYAEYFGNSRPARSTVEVARLPKDVRVEIDCIAMIPE